MIVRWNNCYYELSFNACQLILNSSLITFVLPSYLILKVNYFDNHRLSTFILFYSLFLSCTD